MNFVKESLIKAQPERVFVFHELPDALERLTPPWEKTRVIKHAPNLHVGSTVILKMEMFGLVSVRWVAQHTAYDPPHMFEDTQIRGPFHKWRHRHIVKPHEEGAILRDEIEYEPPLRFIGRLAAPLLVEPRLSQLFDYRHKVTRQWAEAQ